MPKGGKAGGNTGGDGAGPLSLNGNRKDNTLVGSDYGDNIRGNDGNDILIGKGNDLDGNIDLLIGGAGDDILIGDSGTVYDPTAEDPSTDGVDRLFGGTGSDSLFGGGGDDELQGGDDLDFLDGGGGYDIAFYSADDYSISVAVDGDGTGFEVTFHSVAFLGGGAPGPTELDGEEEHAQNIEGIVGTYYDDVIDVSGATWNGPSSSDGFEFTFDGYYGNDTITGGAGNDCISGGGDDDTIDGKGGDDLIIGGSGYDDLTGGAGADTFMYLSAWDGADVINDFSGAGGDGDTIDLSELGLAAAAAAAAGPGNPSDPVTDGFVFIVNGTDLYIDLNGGGVGGGDDILLATTSVGAINLATDIVFDTLI